MIKLKSSIRVGVAHDAVFLMNERVTHRLEPRFAGLVSKLVAGLSIDTLSDDELAQLEDLHKLKVLGTEPVKHDSLCNYFETFDYSPTYVVEQLEHTKVAVVNKHPNSSFAKQLKNALREYGALAERERPTLTIYIVDVTSKLTTIEYPALIIKVGSYKPSIGPLLSELYLSLEDFNAYIQKSKTCFELEGFQEKLPPHLDALQAQLMIHEALMFIVKAGYNELAGSLVDWDLTTMKRGVWPI